MTIHYRLERTAGEQAEVVLSTPDRDTSISLYLKSGTNTRISQSLSPAEARELAQSLHAAADEMDPAGTNTTTRQEKEIGRRERLHLARSERIKQINLGYSAEHDDEHGVRHLLDIAMREYLEGNHIAVGAMLIAIIEQNYRLNLVDKGEEIANDIQRENLLVANTRTGEVKTSPTYHQGAAAMIASRMFPDWPAEQIERAYALHLDGVLIEQEPHGLRIMRNGSGIYMPKTSARGGIVLNTPEHSQPETAQENVPMSDDVPITREHFTLLNPKPSTPVDGEREPSLTERIAEGVRRMNEAINGYPAFEHKLTKAERGNLATEESRQIRVEAIADIIESSPHTVVERKILAYESPLTLDLVSKTLSGRIDLANAQATSARVALNAFLHARRAL